MKMMEAEEINLEKDKALSRMSEGLIYMYDPTLKQTSKSMSELTRNQNVLLETIQQENVKYTECLALNLDTVFEQVKLYQNKLHNVKKQMLHIHEKSQKLKQRAQRLQQQKEKEFQTKQREKEIAREKEQLLIARPAENSQTKNPL